MKLRSTLVAFVLCLVFAASGVAAEPASNELNQVTQSTQPSFGLDHIPALQGEVGGYPLWQYAASLLWVVLAFVFAAIVDFLMSHQLKKFAEKTATDLDDKLLEVLRTPVKVVVVLLTLNVGIQMFRWPQWAEKILSTLFVIAVAVAIIFIATRLVDLLVNYSERRFFAADAELTKLMMPVLAKSLKAFVIIIGALTTAQHLGLPVASVIAGLGIGGVAVALAAQNTLANVFGTITILTDRPFRVGDHVQVDKVDGAVETIGLRSTRIRTAEGHLVTIPNKIIADSAVTNVTMRPNIRQLLAFSLAPDTTPEKMQEALAILRDTFQKHPLTQEVSVSWKGYGPHSLDIQVVYRCKTTDSKQFLQAIEEINLEVKRRFDAAQLKLA